MSQYAFKSKYDVVIGGGGIAGVSAAVAASRSGVRVAMVEKGITPGGLAVSGLVNVFLPLCDGNGNQIIFGIAEELLKMSIKYGPGEIPPGWNGDGNEKISRYMVRFSPAALGLALDEFLEENGVDVWYDTVITGTVMNGNAIAALSVHNKSGNGLIEGSSFVDATGDADIANIAGCKLISGVSHLSIWAEQASLKTADASLKYGDRELLHNMVKLGAKDSGEGAFEGEAPRCGISGKIVSEYSIASRRHLREYFKEQLVDLGDRAAFPIALPAIPQLRTTRRISGRETVWANSANIKIENPAGVVPSWKECGTLWYIPKGALVPDSCENLFAAGKIISAEEGAAWEAVRSIPAVALTGEIAGKMAGERSS